MKLGLEIFPVPQFLDFQNEYIFIWKTVFKIELVCIQFSMLVTELLHISMIFFYKHDEIVFYEPVIA